MPPKKKVAAKKSPKVEVQPQTLLLKCGTVAIIGRPNVGKSTLMNAILEEKISIVSNVPQTTRGQIRGIYTDDRGQIVFIDTPGFHIGRDSLDKYMSRAVSSAVHNVDVIVHLVDTYDRTGQEERQVISQIKDCGKPIIVGLNKVDLGKGRYVADYIKLWEELRGKPMSEMTDLILFPMSALKGTNVKKLIDVLFENLPQGPFLYSEDVVTDLPKRMAMADLIREKLFLLMREEVPHSIAVIIESVSPKKGKTLHIRAMILVERQTQKEIVIGKGGSVLKEVGTAARKDLEELVGSKVFLELFVKTQDNWRTDQGALEEMGYIF